MIQAMPDPVLVAHQHMAHLHRQKISDGRLPGPATEDLFADLEGMRALPAIAELVHAGLGNPGEVVSKIRVAQELTRPSLRYAPSHFLGTRCGDAIESDLTWCAIGRVLLYYQTLGLGGSVPELRHLEHRPVPPAGHDIGAHGPFDCAFGRSLRYQCADDVPAVIEVDASVDQLEPTVVAVNRQPLQGLFRGYHERFADRHRLGDDLAM